MCMNRAALGPLLSNKMLCVILNVYLYHIAHGRRCNLTQLSSRGTSSGDNILSDIINTPILIIGDDMIKLHTATVNSHCDTLNPMHTYLLHVQ